MVEEKMEKMSFLILFISSLDHRVFISTCLMLYQKLSLHLVLCFPAASLAPHLLSY